MKVSNFPRSKALEHTTLILGGFEGIHNGHVSLIEKAKELGKPISMMLIRDNTKLPGRPKDMYATLDERLHQLSLLGVSYVTVIDLNFFYKNMDGDSFLKKLIEATNATNIVAGEDFKFGKNKKWSVKDIRKFNISLYVEPILKYKTQKISTTLMREIVQLGDVELIHEIAPFPFAEEVKLNSNLKFQINKNQIIPHSGVYAGFATVGDFKYSATIHIDMTKTGHIKIHGLTDIHHKKAKIEYIQLIRKIFKPEQDIIKYSDDEQVQKILQIIYNN